MAPSIGVAEPREIPPIGLLTVETTFSNIF
jgi:hypothetical protein